MIVVDSDACFLLTPVAEAFMAASCAALGCISLWKFILCAYVACGEPDIDVAS